MDRDAIVTIPDLLVERAKERASEPALIVDRGNALRVLAFDEWHRRSNALARGLLRRGLQPGERVALVFDIDITGYVIALLGVLKAGGVAVTPPWSNPNELAYALSHSGSSGMIGQPDRWPDASSGWRASVEELEAGQDDGDLDRRGTSTDLAFLAFTSGTTSRPKAVACRHANYTMRPLESRYDLTDLHTFVSLQCPDVLLGVLIHGGATVVMRQFEVGRCRELLVRYRPTRLMLSPVVVFPLLEGVQSHPDDFASLQDVLCGGFPLAAHLFTALARALPRAMVYSLYSSTEASPAGTCMPFDPLRPTSVGRPTYDTQVQVVDRSGRRLPSGSLGEICLRSRSVPPREYWRQPDSETFRDGWVHTGDYGYLDDEGYLFVVDRSRDVIIRGQEYVSTTEVENVLQEHPAVVEAAAMGVVSKRVGEELAAAVVLRRPVPERALQMFVAERLEPAKVPRLVEVVDALPRTRTGKVDKVRLRERLFPQPEVAVPTAGPPDRATGSEHGCGGPV